MSMIRSPQHLAHANKQEGLEVWKFHMGTTPVEIHVNTSVHQQLLNTDASSQQALLEQIHRQLQSATTTEPPQQTFVKSPIFGHSTPNPNGTGGGVQSPTNRLLSPGGAIGGTSSHPTLPTLPPQRLDFYNHFDTNFDQPKEDDDEAELLAIRERTAELEKTWNELTRTAVVSPKYDLANWTYTAAEEQKIEDKACRNRQHEFEKRTRQYLAAPAKRFTRAYRTCIFHFARNADEYISTEYAHQIMAELIQFYEEVEQSREYCMEVLSQEDKLKNPRYEEYMELKLDQLNECRRLQDQYLTKFQQDSQILQVPQKPEDNSQDIPKVPQPTGDLHPRVRERQERLDKVTPILKRNPKPEVQFQPEQQNWRFYQHGQRHGTEEPQRRRVLSEGSSDKPNANAPPPGSSGNRVTEPQFRFKLAEELLLVKPFDASSPRDYMAFRAQWTNFETKMVKSGRSQEDLYDALLKVLKGSARDLCKNKYHDSGAYKWSIQQLDRLYNKPENLLREMITNLLKTNKMVDTYESLLSGVTKLQEAWHDLNQANLSKEELKGLLFIAASEKNLSEDSWRCWLDVQNNHTGDPLSIFKASTYLGAIETAFSNAQRRREAGRSSTVIDHKNKPTPKPRSTVFGSYSAMTQNAPRRNTSKFPPQKQAITRTGKCVFCLESPHKYQLYCPRLKTITTEVVWQIMRENKIFCQMCLGLGHNQNQCEAFKGGRLKRCRIKNEKGEECSKLHCKYLHQSPKNASAPSSNDQTEQ